MSSVVHETVPMLVWADIDLGIVDMVRRMNEIPGCRTEASCQGTIGEGGPRPYPAHVMASWTAEALAILQAEFEVYPRGNGWGTVCRKGVAWEDPPDEEEI
jgi:hypothetical protein